MQWGSEQSSWKLKFKLCCFQEVMIFEDKIDGIVNAMDEF